MDIQRTQERLFETLHPIVLILLAVGFLAGAFAARNRLERAVATQTLEINRLERNAEQITLAREHYAALRDLKERDVSQFKMGFSGIAKSRKSLFESGLSLQEERRLLEKQLEIMTTYLIINPSLQRVFLMRGEQPLQSYLISYMPLRSFPSAGSLSDGATSQAILPPVPGVPVRLPYSVRIVSKERFAHPERGKSEQVNGHLQYMPPQVGTSVRSNALGEYVMFTNSRLILHGPPVNPEDHEKFPHVCLGLSREAARKLYRSSFIGTKIILNAASTQN